MKQIFIIVFLTFFMVSCITETENPSIEYKFQITNNSRKDIRILAYDNNIVVKETQIFNSETIEKSFISSAMDKAYLFSDVLGGDSIKVIYNNNKFKIFYCFLGSGGDGCNTPRNILNEVNDFDSSENRYLRKYEFLEIDYENAEDCNGNCD